VAANVADFEALGFSSFEAPVILTLDQYLRNASNGPLLTNNEEDLIIINDVPFVEGASQSWLPRDIAERRQQGEFPDEQVARHLRIGRNVVRKSKAEMYTDRLIVAAGAVDTCRSVFRVAGGEDFLPVHSYDDDTFKQAKNRVGDYVEGALQGGRDMRVLRNAAMHRLTDTIRKKYDYDANPEASLALTVIAGMNSRKKVVLYARALHDVSKAYERMNKADKQRLNLFMARRAPAHQDGLDMYSLIAAPDRFVAAGA